MRITIPFSPGHTFWSPRVRLQGELLTVVHEGKEYTRWDDTLEISTRHKKITRVEVTIRETGEPRFRYWGVTVDDLSAMASLVDPHSGFNNETDALDFARHWRDTQGTEFFGGNVDSFDSDDVDE